MNLPEGKDSFTHTNRRDTIYPYYYKLDSAEFSPHRSCHPFAGGGAPCGPCVIPHDFLHFWAQAA